MSTTFIPGWQVALTFDANDLTIVGNILGVTGAKTTPRKPVFGAADSGVISGQKSHAFNAGGHIAAESPIADLLASFDKDIPLAFSIQVGTAAGATDAGTLTGNGVMSGYTFTTDAEGEWDWTMDVEVDGALTHTPPA